MVVSTIVMLSGCGVRLPDPILQSVEPDRGWNGEQTVISVEGANFYPQVQVNANRRNEADLDRSFSAWLRSNQGIEFALSGVSAVDYTHLGAVVEPGLPQGAYDLIIEGPTGVRARLTDAFTVSDTRADRLGLSTESIVYTVNETAFVDLQLLDPSGEPVLADLEVRLQVQGASRPIEATFGAGLENQILAPDGLGLSGFLGADGFARVPITIATPDTVSVEVSPIDPTSAVRPDELNLLFEAGGDLVTEILLPSQPLSVDAGESFTVSVRLLDQFGNPAVNAEETVLLQTSCADFNTVADVQGVTQVTVTPIRSTQFEPDCPEQRLQVLSGPPGSSAAFEVRALNPVSFAVQAGPAVIIAGESVNALISPRDSFGNRAVLSDPVVVTDSVGGLGPVNCLPIQVDRFCTATSFIAGEAVQLLAASGAALGQSDPYVVLAAADVTAVSIEVADTVVAGVPFDIAVVAYDLFGNPIDGAAIPDVVVAVGDELGEVVCVEGDVLPTGELLQVCELLTARATASLSVSVDGINATSASVEVVNGPLATAFVTAPASAEAGVAFSVGLTTFDAHGNPYVDQAVPVVSLTDAMDALLADVVLDADGEGSVSVTLFGSGPNRIKAVASGLPLGESSLVSVLPGTAIALRLQPAVPWSWVGVPTQVVVESIDAFGNRGVESIDVTLSSANAAGPDELVTLTSGVSTVPYTWSGATLDEHLVASGAGLTGESPLMDVVEDCSGAGPSAIVDFGGLPFGRVCLNPDLGSAVMGFSGSVAGDQPIARYSASIDGQLPINSFAPSLTLVVSQGETPVAGLVVDTALCAQETTASIWAGWDNGDPVGPLDVTPASSVLVVGLDTATFEISDARDCTGDPASGGRVSVHADRGEVLDSNPTGAGLELLLDATGTVDFRIDATGATTGGDGTVWLRSEGGGSAAEVALLFAGDDRAPVVWSQTPTGDTTGMVSSIEFMFDEAMLPGSVLPARFSVEGPVAVSVDAVTEIDPRTWMLVLDGPVDGSTGVWTVTASSDLRDLGGNRLDGSFSGTSSDWVSSFGAIDNVLAGVTCSVDTTRFTPDGDPGSAEEADEVVLNFSADDSPAFWTVQVASSGMPVRQIRHVSAGAMGSWSWDGRDATERVVEAGTYLVSVRAEDGGGNSSVPCTVPVTVEGGL